MGGHTSSESSGTFRQKARSLAPLNDWACAVKICHDGMLEDTNSLDAAQINDHQFFLKLHISVLDCSCLLAFIEKKQQTVLNVIVNIKNEFHFSDFIKD